MGGCDTVVSVLNPHIAASELKGKYIELDILAKDKVGDLINVEIQVRQREKWSARSMVYLSKTLGAQLEAGVDYAKLKPVIGIHLLVYDLFPEQDQAFWCFEMRDRINPSVRLGSELQLYVVELAKADRLASAGKLPGWPAWVIAVDSKFVLSVFMAVGDALGMCNFTANPIPFINVATENSVKHRT